MKQPINTIIDRDALRKMETEIADLREVADHRQNVIINMTREANELKAENERLRLFKSAVDVALDGLYGGNADEISKPLPIELLPPDRQELFHRVLELLESEETE